MFRVKETFKEDWTELGRGKCNSVRASFFQDVWKQAGQVIVPLTQVFKIFKVFTNLLQSLSIIVERISLGSCC